jgi:hypothetical protein
MKIVVTPVCDRYGQDIREQGEQMSLKKLAQTLAWLILCLNYIFTCRYIGKKVAQKISATSVIFDKLPKVPRYICKQSTNMRKFAQSAHPVRELSIAFCFDT